jgi:hypothetical protein
LKLKYDGLLSNFAFEISSRRYIKCVRGGAPEGSPWRILVKDDGGTYRQVGAMARRPEGVDLVGAYTRPLVGST